jgi:hypothetical protein
MKFMRALACALLIGLFLQSVAAAQPAAASSATTSALQSRYDLACAAFLNPTDQNIDAATAVLAPGFVAFDPSGTQYSRDDIVAQLKYQLSTMKAASCTTNVTSATQADPNTVVATNAFHAAGTTPSQEGSQSFDISTTTSDMWKLVGGQWEEVQSKIVHSVFKIDGNVVQEQGA